MTKPKEKAKFDDIIKAAFNPAQGSTPLDASFYDLVKALMETAYRIGVNDGKFEEKITSNNFLQE